jgi:hypothetical protein
MFLIFDFIYFINPCSLFMKRVCLSYWHVIFQYAFCLCTAVFLMACTDSNGNKQSTVSAGKLGETISPVKESGITSIGPKPGRWVATVSNGFKGDQLTFTVSADGKRIENVVFKGHWRSRASRTEVLMDLDPPKPFDIIKNSFSGVQQEEKAGMWWEFIGKFTSATTAEGSYRCSFAGGENDTYQLKWTAKRAG